MVPLRGSVSLGDCTEMARVLVLSTDNRNLLHGESLDVLAVEGVREASAGVVTALSSLGHEASEMVAPSQFRALEGELLRRAPDLIFNLVESYNGEARLEAAIASLYTLCRLPYTGSPPLALGLALDKPKTQALLQGVGVPVPAHVALERGDEPLQALRFPVIVKPAREDASHGISAESVCPDGASARMRARFLIKTYRQPALIEEFLNGRELNVSILADGERLQVLPLREIDFSGFPSHRPKLVTFDAKWVENSEDYRGSTAIPARGLDPSLRHKIEAIAMKTFQTIGLRDYGRIDLRLDATSQPFVLDVNANPDISPGAGFASAAALAGLSYAQVIERIVNGALARGRDLS